MSLAQENLEQQPKRKRSRLGCNTCKARKVKCDERQDVCDNCESLHLECTYPSAGQRLRIAVGRRNPRSCNGCRIVRSKCFRRTVSQSSCERCREKSLPCSYQDDGPGNPLSRQPLPRQLQPSRPTGQGVVTAAAPIQTTNSIGSAEESYLISTVPEPAIMQLHWLSSPDLPDGKHIRTLVDSYFQNIHPLRCFSFIHKPSFLQKLADEIGSDLRSDALLHIMCTLGAQFFALEYSDTVQQLPAAFILKAGSQWAATADRLILGHTNQISIDGLMTTQLLHDYALRMGNFTQAFVLSALMARMTQALQINLEYSSDLFDQSANASLSVTARECRRRLMWSCYVTDVLCSNGVDQLTLIFEKDLKIQLPCNNRNFLHQQPSITRTLTGYLIQQLEIRRRVLWYIKHLDQAKLPWLPDSEFAQLDRELQAWYATLPANLHFTASTIYLRKESSQLGALCLFHCTYHQTMLDFYRIGTPELFKLRSAFHFPPEMSDFQRHLQFALFKEARTLGAIIAEAEQHSPRMIGDPWFPTMAYESNRVMLFYLTQVTDPVAMNKRDLVLSSIPYLQSNLKALNTMRATNAMAEGLSRGAESMLQTLGVNANHILPLPNVILDDPYLAFPNRDAEAPQRAADSDLHPLSIFRMARKEIPEGHVPVESSQANPSSTNDILQVVEQPILVAAGMEGLGHNLDMFFTPDLARDWDVAEMIHGSIIDGDGPISWTGMAQMG
ncbi:fungal-specific transcription factor domain-containing protein [Dactylonectria estremocensis]|uniref:Fungal-specific transcription factor domain-containing protein n=1 Tax=Dactylonectria estremocensis TaxID=1079267 RepID=A0A9P9J2U2_9HYPO|nr:fungal-specific transcription factor domain-containing protein [Dactylonectria estremocensis]